MADATETALVEELSALHHRVLTAETMLQAYRASRADHAPTQAEAQTNTALTDLARASAQQVSTQVPLPAEQAAVLLAIGTFAPYIQGKRVLFFIDSNAALGTIIKGQSRRNDFNLYAGTVWHLLAAYGVTPYFLRVPSERNPADATDIRRPPASVVAA